MMNRFPSADGQLSRTDRIPFNKFILDCAVKSGVHYVFDFQKGLFRIFSRQFVKPFLNIVRCDLIDRYVGYLSTVSTSIEEAAYIDGASTLQIYGSVILPLMKPILSTVLIREGLAIWNDFQLPLITLNRSYKMWTLTIYLNNYQSEYGVNYNEAFSCLVLTCLPIVIFYVLMQKQIMGGLTSGAVKG